MEALGRLIRGTGGVTPHRLVGPDVAVALTPAVAPAQAADKKPNIVFILMDNLGYGELGVYGGGVTRGAPTPRIDKLAAEGFRLLNFITASGPMRCGCSSASSPTISVIC